MASTSQPIALPHSSNSAHDYIMADASYTPDNAPFNPASYARHFLGSPISWRAGSFGGRSLTIPPSSIDSDRGSFMNALNIFDREKEICRNYTCCGLHLNDLHALLEHFEEVHIVVLDPTAPQPQAQIHIPFNPQCNPVDPPPQQQYQHTTFDTDEMELELDLDNHPPPPSSQQSSSSHSSPSSGAPTPPDTPISTPLSAYPSPTSFLPHSHLHLPAPSPYTSQPPSPHPTPFDTGVLRRASSDSPARPNLNLNLSAFPRTSAHSPSILTHPEDAFNSYARFSSDYSSCLPGALYNPASGGIIEEPLYPNNTTTTSTLTGGNGTVPMHTSHQQQHTNNLNGHYTQQAIQGGNNPNNCVPPALLFSSGTTTPVSTPGNSRVPSPTSGVYSAVAHPRTLSQTTSLPTTPLSPNGPSAVRATPTSTLSRPASSLLLSKPFRCPKPNCNKSYKQANGLKYHMTHGSCNFAPPKDLEHVKDLLERKRRDKERANAEAGEDFLGYGNGNALSRSASLNHLSPSAAAEQASSAAAYGDILLADGSITETELREVEREAEKRVRPFACGVGDCQRRYKNMNGLRYHYQHSGDHGALGLAMLANGQHECLVGGRGGGGDRDSALNSGTANGGLTNGNYSGGVRREREGRRRIGGINGSNVGRQGSVSVPVSRAGSTSRTGTPVPYTPGPAAGVMHSLSAGGVNGTTMASTPGAGGSNPNSPRVGVQQAQMQAMPFTPPSTASAVAAAAAAASSNNGAGAAAQTSSAQQQAQLVYQAQFAHLQRQQWNLQMQAQAQQAQHPAQQQAQAVDHHHQYAVEQAQAKFVADQAAAAAAVQAQTPQQAQQQQQQQQAYVGMYGVGDAMVSS